MMKGYLDAEMRRNGFSWLSKNGYTTLIAGLGDKRWKMALSCGESMFTCYAAYPWEIPHSCRTEVLEQINKINATAAFGCCFLLETEQNRLIVFRCDMIIADEYSITECFENVLKYTTVALYTHWDTFKKVTR